MRTFLLTLALVAGLLDWLVSPPPAVAAWYSSRVYYYPLVSYYTPPVRYYYQAPVVYYPTPVLDYGPAVAAYAPPTYSLSAYYTPPVAVASPVVSYYYSPQQPAIQTYSGSPSPADSVQVELADDSVEPKLIEVKPGTTVRWTNRGGQMQTVSGDNGSWGSSNLLPGAGYSITFDQPGTYHYHSKHRPDSVKATVVVK